MLLWFIEAILRRFARKKKTLDSVTSYYTYAYSVLSHSHYPAGLSGRIIFYYPAYPVSGRIAKSTIRCIPNAKLHQGHQQ